MDMLTWLKLMPKMKMADLVRNGKTLAAERVRLLNGNDRRAALTDQKSRNVFTEVKVDDRQGSPAISRPSTTPGVSRCRPVTAADCPALPPLLIFTSSFLQ